MDKRYKVVIIGFAHMHINDVAAGFYENPRIDLVACADTHPLVEEISFGPYTRTWNLKFAKEHFGNPRVYEDYVEMLDAEKPDLAIITSDNPRSEDPAAIIEDILEGTQGTNKPVKVIENRIEAINYAISIAQKDDIIVLAGKGHETYQILKDGTIHLDEREVVKEALELKR